MATLAEQLKTENDQVKQAFNDLKTTVLGKLNGLADVGDPEVLKQGIADLASEVQAIQDLNTSLSSASGNGDTSTAAGSGAGATG